MSFKEFEIKVRKSFGLLIPQNVKSVWMDYQHASGMRYCAKATNGMFITGNPLSRILTIDCGGRKWTVPV